MRLQLIAPPPHQPHFEARPWKQFGFHYYHYVQGPTQRSVEMYSIYFFTDLWEIIALTLYLYSLQLTALSYQIKTTGMLRYFILYTDCSVNQTKETF